MEAVVKWNSPKQIAGSVGENVVSAQVAIDNDGNIVVVWEETSGDSNKGSIKGSIKGAILNGSLSFKAEPTLISNANVASSPRLSINKNGKAVAIWLETGDFVKTSTLQTKPLPPKTPTWSLPAIALSPNVVGPRVGVDEYGNTLVIWLRYDQNIFVEGVSQIGDSSDWSDVFVISQTNEFKFAPPQIAVNRGIGAAVWEVETLNGDEVTSRIIEGAIAQISSENSFAWNKPVALSEASGLSSSPQVAVGSSGRAVAIWRFVEPNSYSASIQCKNISNNSPQECVDTVVTLTNNVKKEGYQSVTAAEGESDLALAYWSTGNKVQISKSNLEKPSSWSQVISLTKHAYFASVPPSLDATLLGTRPEVIWSQKRDKEAAGNSLIKIGSINSKGNPQTSQLTTKNASLPDDPTPMIASNKNGTIVAMWLENIQDGSGVQKLMAATGKHSSETSKMLMYWGVDEAFQSDLP